MKTQKDFVLSGLHDFNFRVTKWVTRRPGEIWTRRGGERVTKRPDGTIVPYFGPKRDGKKKEDEGKHRVARVKKPKVKKKAAMEERGLLRSAIGLRTGSNGELISPYFAKSEEALVRLVRRYLAHQEERSKYREPAEMTEAQWSSRDYVKYNRGIKQAEEFAKKYGVRGLEEHDKKYTNSAECRFMLAICLMFAEVAEEFGDKRDASLE